MCRELLVCAAVQAVLRSDVQMDYNPRLVEKLEWIESEIDKIKRRGEQFAMQNQIDLPTHTHTDTNTAFGGFVSLHSLPRFFSVCVMCFSPNFHFFFHCSRCFFFFSLRIFS